MGLMTHTTYKRWVVIATDPSGHRGYFTPMMFWSGNKCTSKDIRFAQTYKSHKAAEKALGDWAGTMLTDIEYLTVTHHIRLNNRGRRNHATNTQAGNNPAK